MLVSLVVPLLNEANSLRELHESIRAAMSGLGAEWEVIYVDDGSTDGSLEVLKELHASEPRVTVLSFGRNLGKSAALAVGFREAAGDFVVRCGTAADACDSQPIALAAQLRVRWHEVIDGHCVPKPCTVDFDCPDNFSCGDSGACTRISCSTLPRK